MKKLFSMLLVTFLAITICFAVAGCNPSGKDDGEKTPGGGNTPGGGGSPAANIYDGSPYAEQWYSGNYGDSIEGVWDSYVLPDFFPEKPATGTIADLSTGYVGKDDSRLSSNYYIGAVGFPDSNHEYYSLDFYGQEAHLAYLTDALEAENFFITYGYDMYEVIDEVHAWRDDYYVFIRTRESDVNEGCTRYFFCSIVPDQMKFPVNSFGGIPLPNFGYIASEYDFEYTDENMDAYPITQTPAGKWYYAFGVYGTTQANYNAYIATLTSGGWAELQNSTATEKRLQKGEMQIDIEYEAENGGLLDIEMASDEDMSMMFDMS